MVHHPMTTPDEKAAPGESHPIVDDVLAQLDKWRHLPAYRLEPRADPFFAVYMRGLLESHFGAPISDLLVPEFPLRKGTLWPALTDDPKQKNLSVKVDYLAFDKTFETAYLVELKTDVGSRRDVQDAYLTQATVVSFQELLGGLLKIALASKSVNKYRNLIALFTKQGFLSANEELDQVVVLPKSNGVKLQIVYVQPDPHDGYDVIDFEEAATFIETQGAMGQTFARHLRRWRSRAGVMGKDWGALRLGPVFGRRGQGKFGV